MVFRVLLIIVLAGGVAIWYVRHKEGRAYRTIRAREIAWQIPLGARCTTESRAGSAPAWWTGTASRWITYWPRRPGRRDHHGP